MAEDHAAPEAGQLPTVWTRDRERQRVAKERAVQRVRSWTAPNEIKDVMGRVSAGAARRILNSSNPTKVRTKQKAVSVATKTREN